MSNKNMDIEEIKKELESDDIYFSYIPRCAIYRDYIWGLYWLLFNEHRANNFGITTSIKDQLYVEYRKN